MPEHAHFAVAEDVEAPVEPSDRNQRFNTHPDAAGQDASMSFEDLSLETLSAETADASQAHPSG